MDEARAQAVAALLKRHRQTAELSQEELAARAGVSVRSISNIERAVPHRPRKDTLRLLADALSLSGADRDAFLAAARLGASPTPPVARPLTTPESDQPYALLPMPPTPLIGRQREVGHALGFLQSDHLRLLTLCGPPGVGKTHLAIEVAHRALALFADGAAFVDLAPLRDFTLLGVSILVRLGIKPPADGSWKDALQTDLRDRCMLLILDNFEHLLPAAPLVADLLAACPHLKVLATSRQPLSVRGEHEFSIDPLPLPDPATPSDAISLTDNPAIALFTQRAQAVLPGFSLSPSNAAHVAAICRSLDGLPLALELAAARLKLLPPDALLARLEHRLTVLTGGAQDLPARQRTLRATLAWSDALLAPEQRALFRRLAIFAGGADLAAIETIHRMLGGDETTLLDDLAALVDHHLVLRSDAGGTVRLSMLETIREYACEQLRTAHELDAARRAHATHYLLFAERAEPALGGADGTRMLVELEVEHNNLRAALGWSREVADAEIGLRLAAALWRFWSIHGHLREGRDWLETLLALDARQREVALHVRAKALHGAGVLAYHQDDYARAIQLYEECLALRRTLHDRSGIAAMLNNLAIIAAQQDDYPRAIVLYEESLALKEEAHDERGVATTLNGLGIVLDLQGEHERAWELLSRSLAIKRRLGDRAGCARSVNNLADVAYRCGDYDRAIALCEESLALGRELHYPDTIAIAFLNFGQIALARGELARARELLEESLALRPELRDVVGIAEVLFFLAQLACECGALPEAQARLLEALTRFQSIGMRRGVVACLDGLAAIYIWAGLMESAVRLHAAAEMTRCRLGMSIALSEAERMARLLVRAHEALGDSRFDAATAAGQSLTLEAAAAEALTDLRAPIASGPAAPIPISPPTATLQQAPALAPHAARAPAVPPPPLPR